MTSSSHYDQNNTLNGAHVPIPADVAARARAWLVAHDGADLLPMLGIEEP